MVLGMGGLATVLSGRIGLGLAGVGVGMGMAFVPKTMCLAFDAAPAATVRSCPRSPRGPGGPHSRRGCIRAWCSSGLGQDPVLLAACLVAICRVRWSGPRGSGAATS